MTEHVVLRRASDARADLQHRRELALIALDDVDEEIREVDLFIEMYHRFSGVTVEEPAFEQATNADIRGAAGEQSHEIAGLREFAPSDTRRPWGADEPFENALLDKLCAFDPSWPDDIKVKWFDAFDKLRAIHLPNNSNNAPAEDARLEDGLSPSKEGDTTSAATDGIAGTSVSSTDPDGGGSNSPETATQSAGSAVAAVTGENAQLADAFGVEPLPADTNPEQEIGGAEGDVRPVLASSDTSGIPTPALDHPTVKPAGERDGSPAAPVTKKERVAQTHDEHPDWTIAKIAAHLNLTTDAVSRHLQALGIKLGHKGSPRKKAPGEPTVREKVLAAHAAHPDWPQKQIADALGIGTGSVSNAVKGLGIEFPKSPNSLPKPDSQRARVEAFLLDHPDATVRDTATALGLAFSRVRAIAAEAGIQFRKLTPAELQAARRAGALKSAAVRRRGAGVPIAGKPEPASEPQHQPFTVGDQDEDYVHPSLAKYQAKPVEVPPAAPVFVAPKGEMAETMAKRGEVAALNGREPWLSPYEAASRLQIPLVNLRIFSAELGIAWAQPRSQSEPKSPILAEKAPTISQRVAALRRMHPTWTPALIAAELGIRASDVRAVDARGLQIIGVTQVAK